MTTSKLTSKDNLEVIFVDLEVTPLSRDRLDFRTLFLLAESGSLPLVPVAIIDVFFFFFSLTSSLFERRW